MTLGLVFLPGFCICLTELKRSFCSSPLSLLKALGYLFFSPLWAIVIHFYSLCDDRYVKSAVFFKTLEGFVEAGPQFALQLSLLLQGRWGESSVSVLEPIIPQLNISVETTNINDEEDQMTTSIPFTTTLSTTEDEIYLNGSLKIFDRIYDQGKKSSFKNRI